MSLKMWAALWNVRDLSAREWKLASALAWFADDEGRCFPGQARLSAMTGFDRRTLRGLLRQLEARGRVVTEEAARQHRTARRRLILPSTPEGASVVPSEPAPEGAPDVPPESRVINRVTDSEGVFPAPEGVSVAYQRARQMSPDPSVIRKYDPSDARAREARGIPSQRKDKTKNGTDGKNPPDYLSNNVLTVLAPKTMPGPARRHETDARALAKIHQQAGALAPKEAVDDPPGQCTCGRVVVRRTTAAGEVERLDYDVGSGRVGAAHICQAERRLPDAESRSPAEQQLVETYVRRAGLHVVERPSDA